jgi:signal transduction histidine kinase
MSHRSGFRSLKAPVLGRDIPDVRRLVLPVSVLAGFVLVFILCLLAQVTLMTGITDVEARASASTLRYVRAEGLLSTMRTQRLLASIYIRDARLDPVASNAPQWRRQLDEVQRRSNEALSQYTPLGDSTAERDHLDQLQREMREFWDTVPLILTGIFTGRASDVLNPLGTREAIAGILDRISELSRAAFLQQQAEVAQAYRVLDRRIWATSTVALVCGFLIAAVVIGYAGRLERRIREQLASQQRLAAKLIHAQEEERRAIARELHDEIGQALTAIKLELGTAQCLVDGTGQFGSLLDVAKSSTDTALDTVRDLSQLLHPSLLDHLGLPATLDWYLQGFSRRTRIRSELTTDRVDGRFAPELETCLYRIAQEGLTNVARHAGASLCRVHLQRLSDTVLLTVEDNGKGFDLQQQRQQDHFGLGLLGVRERVSEFGGTFWLDTAVGRGTRLSVQLPSLLRASEEDDDTQPAPIAVQDEACS